MLKISIAQWSFTKFVQMKVPGSKIVPCQGVLGSNHSVTFGQFTQVSGSGPLGPLVFYLSHGGVKNLKVV